MCRCRELVNLERAGIIRTIESCRCEAYLSAYSLYSKLRGCISVFTVGVIAFACKTGLSLNINVSFNTFGYFL